MLKQVIKKIQESYLVRNYYSLLPYLKPYKVRAWLALLITIPVGVMDTAIPWALKQYIDVLSAPTSDQAFFAMILPALIIAFSIMQSVCKYAATYLNAWVGFKIQNSLTYSLFKKLMRCDASYFDANSSGTIDKRFHTDVQTACANFLNQIQTLLTRFFNSVALMIVLLVISWRLAIVALTVFAVALYPLTLIRKRIKDLVADSVQTESEVTTHYIEAFNGNRVISSYNLYSYQEEKFLSTLARNFFLNMKITQRSGILSPIMHLIVGIGIAAIIWSGSYLITNGYLTIGGFVAFVTSVIMLYQPIKSLGNDLHLVQLSILAIERVFQLLRAPTDITNSSTAHKIDGIHQNITYDNVSFSYSADKAILKNVSITIEAGQTIAIVGNSGGGKSTFVNLLPRFYDTTSGSILIDGVNIKDMDIDSLRDNIAIVFQDNFLFQGTIRENILMGRNDVTIDQLKQAITSACLDEFIDSLELGLDTTVGERGVTLSGGQKQRIAIARAFIKNAPIIILDEATSALDNKAESVVQQAIDNLMKDRTVLVIAHRLSTVRNADMIIVIDHGEIVETGSHNDLLEKKDSVYSSLYKAQIK